MNRVLYFLDDCLTLAVAIPLMFAFWAASKFGLVPTEWPDESEAQP